MREAQPIPEGLRIAVYNAMGGWGPYTLREIGELFRTHGFVELCSVGDLGGVRRSEAAAYQECIDWGDPGQRHRYLRLVEDVLEKYPTVEGEVPSEARAIRRAVELAGVSLPDSELLNNDQRSDLWNRRAGPRVFISHLAQRKREVHELAAVLEAFGFCCFVAHDAIVPSRGWLREIEAALRTCDVLVAYLTPGFFDSEWTDQEVGWILGRDLAAVPISVDGENPRGFLGTYQAIKHWDGQTMVELARLVFMAIADATFTGQRPRVSAAGSRVAPLVSNAISRAGSAETADFWFEMLRGVPAGLWTKPMIEEVASAARTNKSLEPIRDEVLTLVDGIQLGGK